MFRDMFKTIVLLSGHPAAAFSRVEKVFPELLDMAIF